MPQRVYVKGKKTHAKGESFTSDNVGKERERYQISIDLMSLKTTKDYDIFGWVGEFYFKIDGDKMFKARWPNKGVIKLQRNQDYTSKADLNLWTEFKTIRAGQDAQVNIKVILREKDHLKKDQTIATLPIVIKLPQVTDYVVVQDKDEKTKAKLRIQSTRTRY